MSENFLKDSQWHISRDASSSVFVCMRLSDQIPIKDSAKSSRVAASVKVVLTTEAGWDRLGQPPTSDVNWGAARLYQPRIILLHLGEDKPILFPPQMSSCCVLNCIFLIIELSPFDLKTQINILYLHLFCLEMLQIAKSSSKRSKKTLYFCSLAHIWQETGKY